MSPLKGSITDDPLDVRLVRVSTPLQRNVAPVTVDPLRYTELIALIDHELVTISIGVGVLNWEIGDTIHQSHSTVK